MTTANSTKAVPLHVLADIKDWIQSGDDLDWWCENGDAEDPGVWALAQRVAKHLNDLDGLAVTPEAN